MITIILLLPVTFAISSHVKEGPRVAGVNQVSSVDGSHRLQYAFNASEAREVCHSLGLTIASKAQVQSALTQGYQTCRFGWIDEHFAVIPRVTAKDSCGRSKTGLVEWRVSVTKRFDVFCFNESDAGTQLKDTTSDRPLTDYQAHTRSPPSQQDTTLTSDPTSSLSSSHSVSGSISSLALPRLTQSRAQAQPGPFLNTQEGPRLAGVNQVSLVDGSHRRQYAFNASEAREVCHSLGLTIASKAQVQSALTRGYQTCRFGWIDEHFAVIPRVTAKDSCGKGKTGLVKWRASVTKHFDVFCFNESDAGTQLKDTTSDRPLTDYQAHTRSPPSQQDTTLTSDPTSSLTSSHSVSGSISSLAFPRLTQSRAQAQPGPFLNTQVPTKTLLIGVTCALLLVITAVFGLEKLNRSCFQNWDMEGQQEVYVEAEDSMCVMYINEHVQDGRVPIEEESGDRSSWSTTL